MNVLFPTKAAMDRALLLRMLADHEDETDSNAWGKAPKRPDVVMIYSMLADCHRQLVTLSRGVWVLAAIGLFAALRLIG